MSVNWTDDSSANSLNSLDMSNTPHCYVKHNVKVVHLQSLCCLGDKVQGCEVDCLLPDHLSIWNDILEIYKWFSENFYFLAKKVP